MNSRRFLFILTLLLAALLAACGRAPALPADESATYQMLTGGGGQEFLRQISSHRWDDRGHAAAERLSWIARDANSPDEAVAQRAGESAHAIAAFLADNKDELLRLSAGWFGLQHRSVGELNPELVRGYASALTPFQDALVGDLDGVRGFTVLGNPHDFSAARNAFAVIDTDTEAGNKFNDSASQRVHDHLRTYAQAVVSDRREDSVALSDAATLAGVVAGGQRESGNAAYEPRQAQYWINWAGYEIAAAMGARPGDPDLGGQFFTPDGRLKDPDEVTSSDLSMFSTALQNFAFHHGLPDVGSVFRDWYDAGAGW